MKRAETEIQQSFLLTLPTKTVPQNQTIKPLSVFYNQHLALTCGTLSCFPQQQQPRYYQGIFCSIGEALREVGLLRTLPTQRLTTPLTQIHAIASTNEI